MTPKLNSATCESIALSDLGVIGPEEVARLLFNPRHIKADGTVRSWLFSPTDISEKGVSLVRPQHLTPETLKAQAYAIAANCHKPRTAEGVMECEAKKVRAVFDRQGKGFYASVTIRFRPYTINRPTMLVQRP